MTQNYTRRREGLYGRTTMCVRWGENVRICCGSSSPSTPLQTSEENISAVSLQQKSSLLLLQRSGFFLQVLGGRRDWTSYECYLYFLPVALNALSSVMKVCERTSQRVESLSWTDAGVWLHETFMHTNNSPQDSRWFIFQKRKSQPICWFRSPRAESFWQMQLIFGSHFLSRKQIWQSYNLMQLV